MAVTGQIRKGAYFDSVTLMTVGREISNMEGVADAAVVMGTAENKGILAASNLLTPELEAAGDADLLIAFRLEDESLADKVIKAIDEGLVRKRAPSEDAAAYKPFSLPGALDMQPESNLVLISVAGRYAGDLAREALENNLHVMLFSDNVPVEQEVELKQFARNRGLLVMGPDCGTAIINGVPLAFANTVPRGDIGIVAASGTGLQEVSCLIANAGCGISQAIGTGGRDVKKDVGGIMFIDGLKALAADESTRIIVLVAKPPHRNVLAQVQQIIADIDKPVIAILLGAAPEREMDARTLQEAAMMAVSLSQGAALSEVARQIEMQHRALKEMARREAAKCRPPRRFVRGLFSGGTFCTEAQLVFDGRINEVCSNAPFGNAQMLEDVLRSRAHTVVDLGADEFTVGRPHPMIDFSLRNRRIIEEADDPETAVILLDVVLGYGANMDPVSELDAPLRAVADRVSVICSVTGTDDDPQNRSRVKRALESTGAVVMPSNAAACELACAVALQLEMKA